MRAEEYQTISKENKTLKKQNEKLKKKLWYTKYQYKRQISKMKKDFHIMMNALERRTTLK